MASYINRIGIILLVLSRPLFAQHNPQGLKDFYKEYFPIGVAVSPRALTNDEAPFIRTHFNSLTAENAMKFGPIHPKEKIFRWQQADSIVAFAQKNSLRMRGHTLVWHNQNPDWLFVDEKGDRVSKAVLLQRLHDHISNVVGRYKGKIYAWDVVNEAIADAPGEFYRKTPWLEICGEEYIQKAFEWAHEADPDALLFYNDYNEIDPVKRGKILKLISDLKKAGVPIHGAGLQAHWSIGEPSATQLEKTLQEFSETGMVLHITELDISIHQKEHSARARTPQDDLMKFTAQKAKQQEETYQMCFEAFRKYRSKIGSVTFWNVSDRHSWLDNFPVKGRKDFPLLFDQDLKPKSAYHAVIRF